MLIGANMNKLDYTLIKVSKQTRQKLKDIGKKGESYDLLVNKLLIHYFATELENAMENQK